MNPFVRRVLSVVGGMVLASLVWNTVHAVSSYLYPLPAVADPESAESARQAIRALPRMAFFIILVGWVAGAGIGAYAASQFSGRTAKWPGIAVGLLVLAASAIIMFTLPHPRWMWVLAIVFVPAAAVAGSRFALRHPADTDPL